MKSHVLRATFLMLILVSQLALSTNVRIKDIAKFRGARDNQLFGVGLVIGLNGTGDSGTLNSTLLANMMKNFGVSVDPNLLKTRNAALVMVVADIPAFAKPGMRLDVVVASINDAKSLRNGVLMQTPLYGADGRVYAVAQGAVSVGGEDVKGTANLQKRFPVTGFIPNGAIVEAEIPMSLVQDNTVTLLLDRPDLTMASRVAVAINEKFKSKDVAKAVDASTIRITVPSAFANDVISFLALIEEVQVPIDTVAQIVINERTGTIVFGGEVKVSDFVLSYGDFVVVIKQGKLEGKDATIGNLVTALKSLGAKPQDIIAIIQELHKAGAIHAQLRIM